MVTVDTAQLITTLEDAGLSPYQADAYVSTLEFGSAPVTKISEASDVPDPRIYDVLRDLESKGYIELYQQDSLHARAYSFETVTENLQSQASRFTEAAEEIEKRWQQPTMETSSLSIVKQLDTVVKTADEWIRDAKHTVQVSVSGQHYERLRPALRDAMDGGIDVYLSVHTGDEAADTYFENENLATVCTEARRRHIPSPFVAIIDRMQTCFAPHVRSTNEYGLLADDRSLTYLFYWFFLTTQWDVWNSSYVASAGDMPRDYVDIRYCIRDISPILEAGETVRVSLRGIDLETGETRTIEGTVDEVLVTRSPADPETAPIAGYGGRAGMVVDTDNGPVEVGGWGAMVEEFEAHHITLLSVD